MADKDYSWVEPVWNTKSLYPYDSVQQTESGHFQEWDDTPGAERIRVQHKSTTFTEMQPDGSYVTHVMANNYHIVAGTERVSISGDAVIEVKGDCVLQVQGNTQALHQGNYQMVVEGDYNLLVKGKTNINSGNDLTFSALGELSGVYLNSTDGLNIQGDLYTEGIYADSLHAEGAVTAGTGIHAGIPGSLNPLAGITTLGGINAGAPGPTVPGVVNATVMVTAPVIIGYVMTYGTMLMDPEGGAPMIRTIYDMHTHIDPQGGKNMLSPEDMMLP